MNIQLVATVLNALTEIPNKQFQELIMRLSWGKIKKGQVILEAGTVCGQIFFCSQGLFRFYYTSEQGDSYTKSFVGAPAFFASYPSLMSGIPSEFSIEALEDAQVATLAKSDFDELLRTHPCWQIAVRKLLEQLYEKKELRERQLLVASAEERYRLFLQTNPDLHERIPQYHIASYLGINPVSLSRIRKRMIAKEQT